MMKKIFVLIVSVTMLFTCREVDDVTPNFPPVADAGEDESVAVSEAVALDGGLSSDRNDDPLAFVWSFINKPAASAATLQYADSVKASFTPDVAGSYVVRLVVTDNIDVDADTLILTAMMPQPVVSTLSQFARPIYMAADAAGNVYISDYASHVVRRLSVSGQLTTIAGNGQSGFVDAKDPLQAQFTNPAGIAVDASGNIYVADAGNHSIRRISSTGVYTLAGIGQAGYADGAGTTAQFSQPVGLGIDGSGNLYAGDAGNYRIRRVDPQGNVSTLAGNGQAGYADGAGTAAQFNGIGGVTYYGGYVYVADILNNRIRRITGQGAVTTFAGNGTGGLVNGAGTVAQFRNPFDAGADASGNIYVADYSNHAIRKITPQGVVTTVAGTGASGFADGAGTTAQFNSPTGVLAVGDSVYVADYGNDRVRLIKFE